MRGSEQDWGKEEIDGEFEGQGGGEEGALAVILHLDEDFDRFVPSGDLRR